MNQILQLFGGEITLLNMNLPAFTNNGNLYQAGIGPYTENKIVELTINSLIKKGLIQNAYVRPNAKEKKSIGLNNYLGVNGTAAIPDLVINNKIIEFKICRPIRNNGEREDSWFKKVFEPSPQSYSTFLDVIKLCRFRDNYDQNNNWERWVVIIGFERNNEQEYKLDTFFPSLFDYISTNLIKQKSIDFKKQTNVLGKTHLYHQILKLYAFRY